jgi:hypothetical protein
VRNVYFRGSPKLRGDRAEISLMIEIRKSIILRETVFSELGVEANRPITRAVGWRSFATRSPVSLSRI